MIWRIKGFYDDGTYIKYLAENMEDAQHAVDELADMPDIVTITIETADKSMWRQVLRLKYKR